MNGNLVVLGAGPAKNHKLESSQQCTIIMGQLCALSKEKIDIVEVRNKICNHLEEMTIATIPFLQEKLYELTGGPIITPTEALTPDVRSEIDIIAAEIEALNKNIMKMDFMTDTNEVTEIFRSLPSSNNISESQRSLRDQCVNNFLSQASKYIKVEITGAKKQRATSDMIEGIIFSSFDTEPIRSPQQPNFNRTKDSSHGKNFWCFKAKYTCNAEISIDYHYLEYNLNNYFYSKNMMIGSTIRAMAYNADNISKGPYNVKQMELALQDLGLNKLYSEVIMIVVKYWDWVPPNTAQYDERINYKYPILDELYTKYKKLYGKKSSPNSKLSLYILLTMMNYSHCKLYMHDLITSESTIRMYNSILRQISEEAVLIDPTWKHVVIPDDGVIRETLIRPVFVGKRLLFGVG